MRKQLLKQKRFRHRLRSLHLNLPLSQLVTGEVFDDLPALPNALLGLGAAAASPKRAILLSPEMSQIPHDKAVVRNRL